MSLLGAVLTEISEREDGDTDPLAGLTFAFRGYGLPEGAFQDSALTTPADTDSDPMGGWRDNTAVAFTQATSGFRPVLKDVSGSWAARFDGTDDHFSRTPIALAGDFTIFVRHSTTTDCMLIGGSSAANQQILRIGLGGANVLSHYDGSTPDTPSSTLSVARGLKNTVGIIRSGSTLTFYEGTSTRGTSASSATIQLGAIGALIISGTPLLHATGDIHAVLIAQSDMTANVAQIVSALDAL